MFCLVAINSWVLGLTAFSLGSIRNSLMSLHPVSCRPFICFYNFNVSIRYLFFFNSCNFTTSTSCWKAFKVIENIFKTFFFQTFHTSMSCIRYLIFLFILSSYLTGVRSSIFDKDVYVQASGYVNAIKMP